MDCIKVSLPHADVVISADLKTHTGKQNVLDSTVKVHFLSESYSIYVTIHFAEYEKIVRAR